MNSGAKRFLLAAILVATVVSYFSEQFNRYYLGVAIDVGINIILAVSLNLINGHTGQFSLCLLYTSTVAYFSPPFQPE